jgi:cysteine-rich repeat protein
MALAVASSAHAERLLSPVAAARTPGGGSGLGGVARVQSLALGRGALTELRARTTALVEHFPLGADRTVSIELTRFEPFAPDARIEVVENGGVRRLSRPDQIYFTGTVRDEPGTRALVIATRDTVHGFVAAGSTVYPFGPDGAGLHRSYALRDVDDEIHPPPGDFCANDLHRETVETPAALASLVPPPAPVAHAPATLVQADVAIETDQELRAKFSSDAQALDYLASLAAAATAIYERDVSVRLRFSYIRVWTTTDPWSATQTTDQLREVSDYWTDPGHNMDAVAGPHDLVHFISGKAVRGGVAYLNAICNSSIGFGVSQVYGDFDLGVPSQIWDVLVVTHEMGHNFGSPHTHCYASPVDRCYNQEGGACYSGGVVASRGTIMSYCHLLSGGLANIDLVFGSTVSARIRNVVGDAECLEPLSACGDGTVGTGEDCDDGNAAGGDGCSGACRREECGNGIRDVGEECDDGNTTAGDGCSAACRSEDGCGNLVLDHGEECDDGNPRGGDGCSALCRREAVCGNSVVDVGEECDDGDADGGDGCSAACRFENVCGDGGLQAGEGCDDGNTAGGDGCSGSCRPEPCAILAPGQRFWPRARVSVKRGGGGERLSVRGDFAFPVPFESLTPAEDGLMLQLENAAGDVRLDIALPPGGQWFARRRGWVYVDPSGATNGIRKVVLVAHNAGGMPGVRVTVSGRGTYGLTAGDLPPVLTVVLGDAEAGAAGACGRFAFGSGGCTSRRNGSRLACR